MKGHPTHIALSKHKEITSKVISAIKRLQRDCETPCPHLADAINCMVNHETDVRTKAIKLKN